MKRRYVEVAPETLARMFTTNPCLWTCVLDGIPATAKLVHSGQLVDPADSRNGNFFLTFEDESFPELREGELLPPLNVIMRNRAFADKESAEASWQGATDF